jgi:hypothetical protein
MSLEKKKWLASDADIESVTRELLKAHSAGSSARMTYFNCLVAVTTHELRASPNRRPNGFSQELQVQTLESVHARFYAIVVRTVKEKITSQGSKAALESNARTNFARNAKSILKSWIRLGNDITTLIPGKISKKSLELRLRKERAPSAKVLSNQSGRYSEQLLETARTLAAVDRETATRVLDSIIEKLCKTRDSLAVAKVRSRGRVETRASV